MSDGRTDHATAPDEALASPLFFDEATNIVDAGGGVGIVNPEFFKGPTLDGEVSDGSAEQIMEAESTEESLPRSVGDGPSGGEGADEKTASDTAEFCDYPTKDSSTPFVYDGSRKVPKRVVAVAVAEGVSQIGVLEIDNLALNGWIGDVVGAFDGCTALTSIDIPSGVTFIEYGVFYGCTALASIVIPSGVTGIGDKAFWGCTTLASIDIPSWVTRIGDEAFNGCKALTSIVIPSGVKEIGREAFWGCNSLTSINCPGTVTYISPRAFTIETMMSIEENKSVVLNDIWSDAILKGVLDFIEDDPNKAVTFASDGKLPRMDDPRVNKAVFKKALQSDFAVAIKLASARFHLSEIPRSESDGRELRARLPKGGFFVTNATAGSGYDWDILNSLLEKHTKRNTTSVPAQALHLDMKQLCGTSPSRMTFPVIQGLLSKGTQQEPTANRAILEQLVDTNKAEFFTSIAVRAAVQLKWQMFGRKYFLLETFGYVFSLACMVTVSFTTTNWNEPLETFETIETWMIMYGTIVLCFFGVGDICALIRRPVAFLCDVWKIIAITRLVLILTFCALRVRGSANARDVLAYELLFHYIGLLHYLRPWEGIGRPIVMIIQVLRDIKVFAVVLVVIMWGTTNALFSYHKETDSSL